jgi:hypothetical protein
MFRKRIVLALLVLLMVGCLTRVGYAQVTACVGNSVISEPASDQCPSPCTAQGIIPEQMDPSGDFDWVYNISSAVVNCTGTPPSGRGSCSAYTFSVSTLVVNNVECGVCPNVCNKDCGNYSQPACSGSCSIQRELKKPHATLAMNRTDKNGGQHTRSNSRTLAISAGRASDESAFSRSPLYRRHLVDTDAKVSPINHNAI